VPGQLFSGLVSKKLPTWLPALLLTVLAAVSVYANENQTRLQAEIVLRDVIDCFEDGLMHEGVPVYCEASAVVWDGSILTIASDKPVPGERRSAVFEIPYAGSGEITDNIEYLTAMPFLNAVKYEDMTLTPDGAFIIATTGFDRVKSETNEWDGYNTLMFWPVGRPDQVRVISASSHDGVVSSVGLREKISSALVMPEFPDGVPYFKVESVAAIPGDKLLFGIRELGVRYDKFAYSFKIVAVPYSMESGDFAFTGEFELIYDFNTEASSEGRQITALSSIEYDRYNGRLYLLTSYENEETDEGLGGYLWMLSLQDLYAGRAPELVNKPSGDPLLFAHKSEGITVLGVNSMLVFHDDDRVLGRAEISEPETQFSREPHQAAYSLVSIVEGPGNVVSASEPPVLPSYTRYLLAGGLAILLFIALGLIRRQFRQTVD
jgi:hypothetical protein